MRGGKRLGAGRKKGSTKLLPEQQFDLFAFIEDRRRHGLWTLTLPERPFNSRNFRRALHKDQAVRMICNWIARDLKVRWVDEQTGLTVATCNCSGPALANIYHAVRRQYFDPKRFYSPKWDDEIEWDSLDPMRWLPYFEGNPPQPKRTATMIVTKNSIKNQT